jgi:hypothetical protein
VFMQWEKYSVINNRGVDMTDSQSSF